MSIKNIFDKFFYLEEIEEEYAPTQTQAQQAKNTSPKLVQNELQQNFQDPVQKQQPQLIQNRMKKERKMQQQPPRNEVVTQNQNNVVSLQAGIVIKKFKTCIN